ncbi:MAG: sigma-E processing peptidase SpoIIGA [Caloramator sp.]|nr:sigma-E processing peptidase SpoIIGA [Caloramator sp.]
MGDILYIDIVFLENLFMNYFLLYLLKRLVRSKAPNWRLFLSALIGALYVLIILMPNMGIYLNLSMKILVSLLMIVIAFLPYTFREVIKLVLLFYLETFLIGGSIMAIFYLTHGDLNNINGVILLNRISQIYLIIGSLLGIIFTKIAFDYIDSYFFENNFIVDLEIFLDKKHQNVKALIDTGNNLKDPLSGEPVIVVYYKALKDLLPNDLYYNLNHSKNYDEFVKHILNSELKNRIRVIPYNAIGISNGLITGIKIDKLIVKKEGHLKVIEDVIMSFYYLPLSQEGTFDALAFPEIIK